MDDHRGEMPLVPRAPGRTGRTHNVTAVTLGQNALGRVFVQALFPQSYRT